jgi:MFS family permease
MRVLNTKDTNKKFKTFSLPGFRSGSLVKKIIACLYYLSVIFFAIYSISFTLTADYSSPMDVFLTVILEIVIVLILIAPVIVVGFSDHYDWHGIKLVLIILVLWCVLFTLANYISTLFSTEYIDSTNSDEKSEEVSSDSYNDVEQNLEIDDDIIKDGINEMENSALSD